jgi:hypothetical protein
MNEIKEKITFITSCKKNNSNLEQKLSLLLRAFLRSNQKFSVKIWLNANPNRQKSLRYKRYRVRAQHHHSHHGHRIQKILCTPLVQLSYIVGGWLLYKNLVLGPKNKEAHAAMWKAEQQFARDSFQLALNGTSDSGLEGVGFQGFAALADEYSGSPAGSACSYYAGVCNLNIGNFDEAISFLDDVDADGAVLPALKYGLLGDAYSENRIIPRPLVTAKRPQMPQKQMSSRSNYLKKLRYAGRSFRAIKTQHWKPMSEFTAIIPTSRYLTGAT